MVKHEGVNVEIADKMQKAIEILETSLLGIRSSAITGACVDTIKVPYYGQQTPIRHIASTTDAPGRVMVTPHDPALLAEIVNSLKNAGFNAYVFSKTNVAVSAHPLSGEEHEKVKAHIRKLGEEAKISLRGIRKKGRQQIDDKLPKDDRLKLQTDLDNATAQAVARVDQIIYKKLQSI